MRPGDRQHIGPLLSLQPALQIAIIAGDLVARDPRCRDVRGEGARQHRLRQMPLGGEADLRRDERRFPWLIYA